MINPERLSRTQFRFKRSGIHGHITGYQEEVNLNELENSNTSLSINRGYSSKSESLRGNTSFYHFNQGLIQQAATEREPKDSGLNLHRNEHGLFDIPPGFVRGLEVGGGGSGSGSLDIEPASSEEEEEDSLEGFTFLLHLGQHSINLQF